MPRPWSGWTVYWCKKYCFPLSGFWWTIIQRKMNKRRIRLPNDKNWSGGAIFYKIPPDPAQRTIRYPQVGCNIFQRCKLKDLGIGFDQGGISFLRSFRDHGQHSRLECRKTPHQNIPSKIPELMEIMKKTIQLLIIYWPAQTIGQGLNIFPRPGPVKKRRDFKNDLVFRKNPYQKQMSG